MPHNKAKDEKYLVSIGTTIHLSCQFDYAVQWKFNGGALPQNVSIYPYILEDRIHFLKISPVTSGHEGSYECYGQNIGGNEYTIFLFTTTLETSRLNLICKIKMKYMQFLI